MKFTKYLKREISADLIYVPIFLAVLWIANYFGWVQFPEAVLEFLAIGTIAGVFATIIAVKYNK